MNKLRQASLDQEIEMHMQNIQHDEDQQEAQRQEDLQNSDPLYDEMMSYNCQLHDRRLDSLQGHIIREVQVEVSHEEEIYGKVHGFMPARNYQVLSTSSTHKNIIYNSVFAQIEKDKKIPLNVTPGAVFMVGDEHSFEIYMSKLVHSGDQKHIRAIQLKQEMFSMSFINAVKTAFMLQAGILALGRDYILSEMQQNSQFAATKIPELVY
jgi:hypothetical protein